MTLADFKHSQEEFNAVVQEALTYGPDPALNERFRRSRAQVQSQYPHVRTSFGKVWTTTSDPMRFHGQHTDPIERMLSCPNLDGLLKQDVRQIQRDLEDIATAFELCAETELQVV